MLQLRREFLRFHQLRLLIREPGVLIGRRALNNQNQYIIQHKTNQLHMGIIVIEHLTNNY